MKIHENEFRVNKHLKGGVAVLLLGFVLCKMNYLRMKGRIQQCFLNLNILILRTPQTDKKQTKRLKFPGCINRTADKSDIYNGELSCLF